MRARLTVSLPADLVKVVRARAALRGQTLSSVVAEALGRLQREERNRRIFQERVADGEEERAFAAWTEAPDGYVIEPLVNEGAK